MNAKQQENLNMQNSVIGLFSNNESVWSSIAPLAQVYNQFLTLNGRIIAATMSQEENETQGYTEQKTLLRQNLISLTFGLCLKMRSYAKMNINPVLEKVVDYSKTDLNRLKEQELVNRCQTIHDRATENLATLAPYLVSADLLTAVQTAIDNFKPLTMERDAAGDKRTVATADLKTLFGEVTLKLDLLDDAVAGMISDQVFVTAYKQARKVRDAARRKDDEDDQEATGS